MTEIRIDADGLVATDPVDFADAVALVRTRGLPGLWIRPDSPAQPGGTDPIDLSLLRGLPTLRDFGIAPGLAVERLEAFETIYVLRELEKLAMHSFPSLDLDAFERLEILMLTDAPSVRGLERVTTLRRARITGLRGGDLGVLSRNPRLTSLTLVRAKRDALVGLDTLAALEELELSHCTKLRSFAPLPPRLRVLKILSCPKLASLEPLRGHPTIERIYATELESLAFVPTLLRLEHLGFERLADRDLGPLLASPSLRRADFPAKKSYSHGPEEIRRALERRDG